MTWRSKTALLLIAAAVAVAVAALVPATESQTVYRVGGDDGWTNIGDYNAWANGEDFKVGDILEFVYQPGVHNVVFGDPKSYQFCSDPKNGAPWLTSGDDRVRLGGPWEFYFMSLVEAHCEDAQELAVATY